MNIIKTKSTDYEFFYKLQSDPKVRLFLGGPVAKEEIDIKFQQYLRAIPPTFHFAVRSKKCSFIDLISLDQYRDETNIELSYQFLPKIWGNGFAFEATNTILEYALHTLKLPTIIAETQKKNIMSIRLLKKLNMKLIDEVTRFGESQLIFSK